LVRECAARDGEYEGDHRGVRQVRGRARPCRDESGDGPLHDERRLQGRPARVHGEAQAALHRKMTLKVESIRVRAVAVPIKRPLQPAIAAVSVAPLLLIDLQTDGGIVGRSYLFSPGRPHMAAIAELVKAMAEMVKGDAVAPFDLEKKLRARYALLGVHNMV